MPLNKHKTLFLSSRDRVAGDKTRFRIDLAELLWDLEPDTRDPESARVDVSVDSIWIPYKKGSGPRQARRPNVFLDPNLAPPPIRLLRLKSNIPNHNLTSGGYTDILLQFPFMEHYKEAEPTWDESLRDISHVSYRAETDHHSGRFTLLHGPQASLGQAEFYLTDEVNRTVTAYRDWYFTLTVWCEGCVDKKMLNEMEALRNAVADTNDRLDTLILLSLMREKGSLSLSAGGGEEGEEDPHPVNKKKRIGRTTREDLMEGGGREETGVVRAL